MIFPNNIKQIIVDSLQQRRILDENPSDEKRKLMDVVLLNGETKEPDPNLESWTLEDIDGLDIELQLNFAKPG